MTIWTPDISSRPGPIYLSIADAIADDITDGKLKPGDRMPPQRNLAYDLKVTIGTITRAYKEAERRGFLAGEVGRGTYVKDRSQGSDRFAYAWNETIGTINLGLNNPPAGDRADILRRTMQEVVNANSFGDLMKYQSEEGLEAHRQAFAHLVTRKGMPYNPDCTSVTNGGQHGMTMALMSVCKAGDTVLTEELTYPGMKGLAETLGLKLHGLRMDHEGIIPGDLDKALKNKVSKVLYCMPTFQNPTSACMSEGRRKRIADIVKAHDALIIEDDVYGMQHDHVAPPIATFAPDHTCYIFSAAKCMAPGLRIGFLQAPKDLIKTINRTIRVTNWMVSPVMADVVARWCNEGTAEAIINWHQQEALTRQEILHNSLKGLNYQAEPGSYHAWLTLPEHWNANDFSDAARQNNVIVMPDELFRVGKSKGAEGIRICLGSPEHREHLAEGLRIIKKLCQGDNRGQISTAEPSPLPGKQLRLCFIGDSFVNGTGHPDFQGWVGRVCEHARSHGHDITAYNLGVRRNTSVDIAERWKIESKQRIDGDDVEDGRLVFSFGVNDCVVENGRQRVSRKRTLEVTEQILTEASQWKPCLFIGPPPTADEDLNKRVDLLGRDIALICHRLGIPYLPTFTYLLEKSDWVAEAKAYDGAHPGEDGYQKMAERIIGWDAWQEWLR